MWSSIDFKAGTISVRTNLVISANDSGVELKAPKSKKSRRVLDMPQELTHELKVWKLRCPLSEHDLIFTTAIGGFIHRKKAGNILDDIVQCAEVRRDRCETILSHCYRYSLQRSGRHY